MSENPQIQWLDQPQAHDYPAAESYLNLLYLPATAAKYVAQLKLVPITQFKAKDIFRASYASGDGHGGVTVGGRGVATAHQESLVATMIWG